MTTHAEQRTVLVPDGLAGERVDAAMARMFGLSRTRAADLIAQGLVHVDGAGVGKSDRVHAGSMLDVTEAAFDPGAELTDFSARAGGAYGPPHDAAASGTPCSLQIASSCLVRSTNSSGASW